ncbi:nucleophile aminohydrolase [Pelagophyceae sp. CCMP2097]|nr:nucleophile aminohydrolase [Pelagophyceae sp. CCMP2097]|mmetsp:Transcript_9949/g.32841  ORF Transcript_9949/g.32841 Transcript_9949/m.32841 type:complete len:268 (-) Transcript_9949:62-865(-)
MASTGAGYDLSATSFSPDGRIFQVEYATKAVENGGTVIGLRCKDGVVLGVEKIIFSKMLVHSANRRVSTIDEHAGIAIAGLGSDGRQIVERAREECASYLDIYGSLVPPAVVANRIADYVHYFTIHGALRPFGAAAVLAAYDAETKQHELYTIEPSGVCLRYFGCALGKGRQSAKSEIEKLDLAELTCREALKQIAKMIHTVFDESKDKPFVLEMSWLCEETAWKHELVPPDLIKAAEEWAKKELNDDDDDDDDDGNEEGDGDKVMA